MHGFSSPADLQRHAKTRSTAKARRRWRDARDYQVNVQRALSGLGLRFVEWLLLESLYELLQETGDGVSQTMIAERAGVSEMVASKWLIRMEYDGLLDRGLGEDERSHVVNTTTVGEEALARSDELLKARGLTDD
jgi:DNA-binding MarR family transcriptional regulator